jgi:hypothetical protein
MRQVLDQVLEQDKYRHRKHNAGLNPPSYTSRGVARAPGQCRYTSIFFKIKIFFTFFVYREE